MRVGDIAFAHQKKQKTSVQRFSACSALYASAILKTALTMAPQIQLSLKDRPLGFWGADNGVVGS